MPVESVKTRINPKYNASSKIKIKSPETSAQRANQVSFKGGSISKAPNVIVGLMDFIAAGGYAAAFIIQDGLGFIAPRVGKGLLRGGKKKKDENGNDILDKNGEPKRHLNWAYARKEGIREVITGPSAFIIPYFALKYIDKKFGSGNNVKLNYINGFSDKFKSQVVANIDSLKEGHLDKTGFYEEVFKDVIEKSVNSELADSEKMSAEEIEKYAKEFTSKQIATEKIYADKSLNKAQRNAKLGEIGSVVDDFMALKKAKIGGAVNEMEISISSANGAVKGGNIEELLGALRNYFDDAVKNTHEALKKDANANLDEVIKKFTNRRMGSRILTNLGLFLTVAAFYTQIPKLYNLGTNGKNPALMNDEEDSQPALQTANKTNNKQAEKNKDVSFGGKFNTALEKGGNIVFNTPKLKSVSDIFELSGPVIQGNAMAVLLYAFCIPPRLKHAQDKYDYGEIILRDMTAFTALLFGAKALARLFSDGFTKLTGLALNKRNLEGRSLFQKVIDYLNPSDTRHSVLSSKQLESKYIYLDKYKNGVIGFMDFIKQSGGDIKKALSKDKNVKSIVDKILQDFNGKTFAQATSGEIEQALSAAHAKDTKLIKEFYELFKKQNGLLNWAKTCNSAFGFLSTLVLVPGLIISLTDICKKMTEKRQAKEKALTDTLTIQQAQQAPLVPSSQPTMAGFLGEK